MELDVKQIDGEKYILLKIFNDIVEQLEEVISEQDSKIDELNTIIFNLQNPGTNTSNYLKL